MEQYEFVFKGVEGNEILALNGRSELRLPIAQYYFTLCKMKIMNHEIIPHDIHFLYKYPPDHRELVIVPTLDIGVGVIYNSIQNPKNLRIHLIALTQNEYERTFEKLDVSKLKYIDNIDFDLVHRKKIIGEYFFIFKDSLFLTISKEDVEKKPDIIEYKFKARISDHNRFEFRILNESNSIYHSVSIASFYITNNIDHLTDPQFWVNKEVEVTLNNGVYIVKLSELKADPKADPKVPIEYTKEVFRTYLDTTMFPNLIEHPSSPLERTPFKFTQPGRIEGIKRYRQYYVSIECGDRSLQSAIGLGLTEHLLRFPNDSKFFNHIKSTFTTAATYCNQLENFLESYNRHFRIFYDKFVKENILEIQNFGTNCLNNVDKDLSQISGIQRLSDILGICIDFSDFTDFSNPIKIIPLHDKPMLRPMIKLGKYYDKYFLLYSKKMMEYDGYYESNGTMVIDNGIQALPFSKLFYDMPEISGLGLTEAILSLKNKIEKINNAIKAKVDNTEVLPDPLDFSAEVQAIKNYATIIEDKEAIKVSDELLKIDFISTIRSIKPSIFICLCCQTIFLEKFKVGYPCGCSFFIEHNNTLSKQQSNCGCQGHSRLRYKSINL